MPHQELIVAGKKWPSATQLTDLLPQGWLWGWYARSVEKDGWAGWQANKRKSEEGKALGTEVHSILDDWINGNPMSSGRGAVGLAAALWREVNPTVQTWVKGDTHVQHARLKIHGSFDAIVKKDNELRIGDFKTSFIEDSIAHPIQLCVYAMCWNSQALPLIDTGEIWRVDKKTLKTKTDVYSDLKQYIPVVKALRVVWNHVNGGK